MAVLKRFRLGDGKVVAAESEPAPIWVFASPTDDERRLLVEDLELDEHTLASALDPDELSRVEFEPDHVAVIFKRPRSYTAADKLQFRVVSVGLFLFAERLVIVLSEDAPLFEGRPAVRAANLTAVVLKLISRSINHFIEHLRIINQLSDALEGKIASAMENRYLLNLFTLEKSLVYYLSAIGSNGAMIDRLRLNAGRIGFQPEQVELVDDLAIENQQCYRQAEIYSNILSNLMDARVSIVNNNLSMLMKTLNVVTIGIMVPTFVVSAFSMNVAIPMQHRPHAFWLIMGMAALAVLVFMGVWRVKRW